jgi:hypothetical protein
MSLLNSKINSLRDQLAPKSKNGMVAGSKSAMTTNTEKV